MGRSFVTALLVLLAAGSLAAGIVIAASVNGDRGFGIGVALMCVGPAFALIALAMRFGLGGDDDA